MEEGRDDTNLLLVTCRIVTNQLLVTDDFSVHEAFELGDTFVHFFLLHAIHLAYEVEVFFRSEVIYQEAIVDECTCMGFPV